MALEDRFKDELKDIGILSSFTNNLKTIEDVDKREQIYRTAAMIIGGRDDPEIGRSLYKEFITKNPEGVNSLINSNLSSKVNQRIDTEKFKDLYESNIDEIVDVVAGKINADITKNLNQDERKEKYRVVSVLEGYFNDIIDIPQNQDQAREILARNVGVSPELITESTVEDSRYIAVRLTSAKYLMKSNGEYKIDKAKLKELMEKSIEVGAMLYSKADQ
jgi:hypothetical protein